MTSLQIDYVVQVYFHFRCLAVAVGFVQLLAIIWFGIAFSENGRLYRGFFIVTAGLIATLLLFVVMPEVDLFRRLLETL